MDRALRYGLRGWEFKSFWVRQQIIMQYFFVPIAVVIVLVLIFMLIWSRIRANEYLTGGKKLKLLEQRKKERKFKLTLLNDLLLMIVIFLL